LQIDLAHIRIIAGITFHLKASVTERRFPPAFAAWENVVNQYRIFILDTLGRTKKSVDDRFADDDAARAGARLLLNPGEQADVWDQNRIVARVSIVAPSKINAAGPVGNSSGHSNELLNSLPHEELAWLYPHLSHVRLVNGQVLYERGGAIEHAYFIEAGMASVVSGASDDELGVEVGLVGREGLAGCVAMFEEQPVSFCRTMIQMPGAGLRIPVARLREAAAELPNLRRLGFRFIQALMAQASQGTACNATHPLRQRAARWILMAHDRADGDQFELTQGFLANMLGVRRPGVTQVAVELQKSGLISYSRGVMRVTDRAGLEAASCSCYRIVHEEYDRLLGGAAPTERRVAGSLPLGQ
jgi:CRP-like cAMP-binding protein